LEFQIFIVSPTARKLYFEVDGLTYEVDPNVFRELLVMHATRVEPEIRPGVHVTLSDYALAVGCYRSDARERRKHGVVINMRGKDIAVVKWDGLKHPEDLHIKFLKPVKEG